MWLYRIVLGVSLLSSAPLFANPVIPDEYSIRSGARLYDMYCSECHGIDLSSSSDEFYESTDTAADEAALMDIARGVNQSAPQPPEEEWPEWADRPDPEAEPEPDVRSEIISTLTAVYEEANLATEQESVAEPEFNAGGPSGFDPMPGVTDLSEPSEYFYGTSEDDLFNSIANGTGAAMPGWRLELGSDEAIWNVVNYIRSHWGDQWLY
jgi:mono/diheme cytochrome c family protein